jgi:hypothetical protein
MALGYEPDERGFESREFFSSPPHPHRLWSPPILIYEYQGLFPWV